MRWKRALTALAAAGMFVGLGAGAATAQSAAGSRTYHMYNNTYGIPASVKAGTTFYADAWYMQNSPVRVSAVSYGLSVWSLAARTDRGFTVSWLNPVTHRWQASTGTWSQGAELQFVPTPANGVAMVPHKWYKIQFKITVGKNVPVGTWHLNEATDGIVTQGTAPHLEWLAGPDRAMRVHH
ncbi:hypothetical protein [Streptacidiphilus melanogenes]|uniref:hypothetical protein n=1 Tax=Streptacidiphilus melanogenes TaxID=411235 RepID=UPI0005AA351B|nr:hypothetical protein [Streptacidiphilus melanogenes]